MTRNQTATSRADGRSSYSRTDDQASAAHQVRFGGEASEASTTPNTASGPIVRSRPQDRGDLPCPIAAPSQPSEIESPSQVRPDTMTPAIASV